MTLPGTTGISSFAPEGFSTPAPPTAVTSTLPPSQSSPAPPFSLSPMKPLSTASQGFVPPLAGSVAYSSPHVHTAPPPSCPVMSAPPVGPPTTGFSPHAAYDITRGHAGRTPQTPLMPSFSNVPPMPGLYVTVVDYWVNLAFVIKSERGMCCWKQRIRSCIRFMFAKSVGNEVLSEWSLRISAKCRHHIQVALMCQLPLLSDIHNNFYVV